MTRFRVLFTLVVLGAAAGVLLSLNGCGASSGPAQFRSQPIQHVVVIVQENRSTDNLFQDPVLYNPPRNADIAQFGVNSVGTKIPLSPIDLGTAGSNPQNYDLNHNHSGFIAMCTGGTTELLPTSCTMNGADLIPVTCDPGEGGCPPPHLPPNPQFMYVNPSDVQPYFQLAEQYTFADRMFQTNEGPSFPAHQFIISGTSAPAAPGMANSDLFASTNVAPGPAAGCTAPPGSIVSLIDPAGKESQTMYPCFEHPTLTDRLDAGGISWRYYTVSPVSIWTGPNAIQHMCVPQTQNNQLVCTGSPWQNVIIPQTQVLTDIASNQLAQVTWVIPDGRASDHAGTNDGSGPSWVASVVNAIGNSPYWANTAIFIIWDDWGGWYDHVPPKIINSYEYGFRVPLIVVSPYAKAAYTSHVTHDFGSILEFIEENYGLLSLGYADAAADDLSDCFDLSQTPLRFQTIQAPLGPEHFLNDRRPPKDPDDD